MVRRIQTQGPDPLPLLQPTATPVNQFVNARPYTPKQFITDFSGLSETLGRVASTLTQDRSQQAQADAKVALSDPGFMSAVNSKEKPDQPYAARSGEDGVKREFNRLVQSGKIKETQSPYFWETVYKTAAQDQIAAFRRNAYARMDEATSKVVPDKTIEQIMDEEWNAMQGSSVLSNYFAQQQVGEAMPAVRQELQDHAAKKYQDTVRLETRRSLAQQAVDTLDGFATKKVWTPEDYASLSQMVTGWHEGNIQDARGLFADALTTAVTRLEAFSAVDAKDMLANALDIEVAGVPLGDDAEVGKQLNARLTELTHAADRESDEMARKKNNQRALALDDTTGFALAEAQKMIDAKLPVKGAIPNALVNLKARLEANGQAEFYPEARDHLETIMRNEDAEGSQEAFMSLLGSLDQGMLSADDLVNARRTLNLEQYGRLNAAYQARQQGAEFLELPAWTELKAAAERSRAAFGVADPRFNPFADDLVIQAQNEYLTLARSLANSPSQTAELQKFSQTKLTEIRAAMKAHGDLMTTKRQEFLKANEVAALNFQTNTQAIVEAIEGGVIGPVEGQILLNKDSDNDGLRWMSSSPDIGSNLQAVERIVAKSPLMQNLDDYEIQSRQEFARNSFRNEVRRILSEAGPEAFKTVGQRDAAVAAAAQEAVKTVAKQFGVDPAILEATPAEAGKAKAGQQAYEQSKADAAKEEEVLIQDREAYSLAHLPERVQKSRAIPQSFKSTAVKYYSDSFMWGTNFAAKGQQFDSAASGAVSQILRSEWAKRKPEEADKDIVAIRAMVGIKPEELLAGSITVSAVSAEASKKAPRNRLTGAQLVEPDITKEIPLSADNLLGMQTRLDFPSVEAMMQFFEQNDERKPEILKLLGIKEEDLQSFLALQETYILSRP